MANYAMQKKIRLVHKYLQKYLPRKEAQILVLLHLCQAPASSESIQFITQCRFCKLRNAT